MRVTGRKMAERGFPSFSGNASASTRALSLLTSSAAFSHESSSDMSRERKEEAKKNRGSFSCFTKEAKNKLFRTTLGSFGSSAFRENGRLAGTRSVLYSPRSGGLSVPVGVMVEEREATREAASRDGTKESRGERERARAAREQPRSPKISVLSSFLSLSFPFFCPALLENSNAVRGERTPSLSALWKSLPAPRTTAPSSSQPSTGAARRRRRRREQQQKQRRRRKTKHRRRHLGRCPFLLRRRSRRLLCRPLRAAPSGPIAAGVITLGCILSSAEGE